MCIGCVAGSSSLLVLTVTLASRPFRRTVAVPLPGTRLVGTPERVASNGWPGAVFLAVEDESSLPLSATAATMPPTTSTTTPAIQARPESSRRDPRPEPLLPAPVAARAGSAGTGAVAGAPAATGTPGRSGLVGAGELSSPGQAVSSEAGDIA